MYIDLIKRCALTAVLVAATSLALPVNAARGGGYGGAGPGWWGLGLGLGLGWEVAHIASPYYYPPYPVYYYPAPQYYYPPPPTVVIESPPVAPSQGTAVAPNTPYVPNWYYCPSLKGYYPQVRECAEPWRIVPGTPPGAIH